MTILFAALTNNFVSFGTTLTNFQNGSASNEDVERAAADFRSDASRNALILVYIGLAMFGCTFVYMYSWVYTGEALSKRIREKYLRATLRQDIAFFDDVGAGEVTSRIQTDTG